MSGISHTRLHDLGLTALIIATFGLSAMAGPAAAERLKVRIGAGSAFSECYCRANGQRFEVGQSACLRGAQGPKLAACEMSQNVTSWRLTESPCPDS